MAKHGPNVTKLIIRKMTMQMIPNGAGLADALGEMVKPGGIGDHARQAEEWVMNALEAVRNAPGCRYGDDEEIAAAIIDRAGLK